jgi:hypothetical protein
MDLLQGKPPCEFNVSLIVKLSSLTPNIIVTNRSCIVCITNIVENVDNSKKFNSIKEDEGIIDEHGTHTMPLARIIN